MATGWPMKVSYANGDVYSSSDVNDTNGTINLLTSTTLSQAGGKNAVINGGFDIWQRGTSFLGQNSATNYSADRWVAYRTVAGSTFTRQLTNDTTNLPNIQYCLRVARDSGNTATNLIMTLSNQESLTARPFAGKTVTVSWYARAGANFSAASSLMNYEFITGTGTDQNVLLSYTGQVLTTGTKTLTTTWQRFSYTVTLAATATEFALDFYFTPVGTAGAADYFEITGVQVELGSTATTFSRAGGTIQGELAACQRYYWRSGGDSLYQGYGNGFETSTTASSIFVQNPTTMRTAPSSIDFSTLLISTGNNTGTVSALTIAQGSAYGSRLTATHGAFGAANTAVVLLANNSLSAYLGFSAEL